MLVIIILFNQTILEEIIVASKTLTRKEYKDLGLTNSQIDAIYEKHASKDQRAYKWIVKMTTKEALQASKKLKKEFVRATEWSKKQK